MAHERTGVPTRYPSGVNNAHPDGPGAALPFPDPSLQCLFFDDFHAFSASAWTVTSVGAIATLAVQDAKNGILQITTSTGASAAAYVEWPGEEFTLESGKQLHVKTRLKVGIPSLAVVYAGLHVNDTTPVDASHRAVFFKAGASTSIRLDIDDNTTETNTTLPGVMPTDTYTELTLHYDGGSTVKVYQDDAQVAEFTATNLPGAEPLTVGFGVVSTSGAATLSMDYVMVAEDR